VSGLLGLEETPAISLAREVTAGHPEAIAVWKEIESWIRAAGVSVEATVRKGPVTLLNLTQTGDGKLCLIANQGEAIEAPILKIGNTMTHVKFAQGPTQVMNQWFAMAPTHHAAMSVGHNTSDVRRVAKLMGIPFDTASIKPE
jgi:L-arabinose isomerase